MTDRDRSIRLPADFGLVPALVALLAVAVPADAQWPAGQAAGWAKLSLFSHSTTERYDAAGEVRRFLGNGESVSRAVFLDVLWGVHDVVDVWVQVPWFDLSFDDVGGDRDASGLSDVRGYLRYGLGHHLLGGLPLSVRAGAKVPVTDFPVDAEVIPVGEGQWDLELWLEGGHSFHPVPAYAVAWLGYRWRLENEVAFRDPGDERVFLLDLGLTTRPLGAKVVLEGAYGLTPEIEGLEVASARREILQIQPELLWRATDRLTVEAGLSTPLTGRNHPAGTQLLLAGFFEIGG